MAQVLQLCLGLGIILSLIFSLAVVNAKSSSSQQEETRSHPLKIVVSLDYTKKQFRDGVGKVLVTYKDSDGFKKEKKYDIDEMMKRSASHDSVKVKAKFPRNTVTSYEDYLICVTVLSNHKDKCVNESRSPSTDKERVHLSTP